mgnify:CR=1 FL=1
MCINIKLVMRTIYFNVNYAKTYSAIIGKEPNIDQKILDLEIKLKKKKKREEKINKIIGRKKKLKKN